MNRLDWMDGIPSVRIAFFIATFSMVGIASAGFQFPHSQHSEMDIECETCHENVPESQSAEDHLLPTTETCLFCHEEDDLSFYGWEEPKPRHSGFPKYSHKAHLAMKGNVCTHCHGVLIDPTLVGTGKGWPGHDLCWECHDGKQATDACESCHEDIARLRPKDHHVDYVHTHQYSARESGGSCESCHRQSEFCSDCHQGENVLFLTHDRNYLFTHPQEARKQEHDCVSCHDRDLFCVDCHAAEGIAPTNHRPLAGWSRGGHATEARRDITYCASCHPDDGADCRGCHGEYED